MIEDFKLAFSQLSDSRLWKPILWATVLSLVTIVLFIVLWINFFPALFDSFSIELPGWLSWADGWLGPIVGFASVLFMIFLGYFFFASVYAAFLGLFIDDVLDAVREAHYPDLPWVAPPKLTQSITLSLKFILWSLFVYLLASPLLLLGCFMPPIGLLLQYLIGGYLLGREYGQMVECRLPRDKRKKNPGGMLHGVATMFLWTFPVVNLIAPLLLAVSLTHARLGNKKAQLSLLEKEDEG